MEKHLKAILIAVCFSLATVSVIHVHARQWTSPINEVADYNLQDIAAASYDSRIGSFIIRYNPTVVENAGPLVSAFFRAHEYGHILRGHVTRQFFVNSQVEMVQLGRASEIDADRYATNIFKDNNPEVIEAIVEFFESSGSYGDLTHLPHTDRAKLIRQWAGMDGGGGNYIIVACTHPVHQGDLYPCTHVCGYYYGNPVPCHPNGDVFPCQHPAHPDGHRVRN